MRRGLAQRVTTEKQQKMASSEKHLLRINRAPIGEEPREATLVSFRGLLLKRVELCRRRAEKGGRELTQDPQMLVL